MKHLLPTTLLALAAASGRADIFGDSTHIIDISFVTIGNAGNSDDAGAGGGIYSSPHGGVPYVYRMGVTEVPWDYISKATALGLTNVSAAYWGGFTPGVLVTWYEAAAFVNWLNTSTGHQAAYQLDATNTALTLWPSTEAWQLGGENLYRHKDAFYFLPSEDEWYKAAYHKNDGVTANYWDYATGSNGVPGSVSSGTMPGTAVYNILVPPYPADVFRSGGLSPYGTQGQNGNVNEWMESAFDGTNDLASEGRTARGGAFSSYPEVLRPSARGAFDPADSRPDVGFRVASVPEPSSAALLLAAGSLASSRAGGRRTSRARVARWFAWTPIR